MIRPVVVVFLFLFLAGCSGGGGLAPGGRPGSGIGPGSTMRVQIPWPGARSSGKAIPQSTETIQVTITGSGLVDPLIGTASKSQIQNGQVTLTFSVVPPGSKTVEVKALGSGGELLAHRVTSAEIQAGVESVVRLELGVTITDTGFIPQTLSLSYGETILWINGGSLEHNVTITLPTGQESSGILAPGARFSRVVTAPGDFSYACGLHPNETGTLHLSSSGPRITGLSPASGPPGMSVTISGLNFGTQQGSGAVTFGGTPATTITSWSDTQITCTVPYGAATGSVVITQGQSSNMDHVFTITPSPPPVVGILSPSSGGSGTSVTITGSYFGPSQGPGDSVTIGGAPALVTLWSDGQIIFTVPIGAVTGPVIVTARGQSSNADRIFTVTSSGPSVTGILPTSGSGGESLTVTGSGFGSSQGASFVTIGGTPAAVSSWSDTQIMCTVPVSATTGPVVVTVGGNSSNGDKIFTVIPKITSLSPTSGPTGTPLTINGTSFGAVRGTSTVTVGGVGVTNFASWSSTQIVCTVPPTSTSGPVIVTVGGQQSNTDKTYSTLFGYFAPRMFSVGIPTIKTNFVAIGDLNGDGKPDLVTANANANNVSVLLSDGSGGFQAATTYPVGTQPYAVAIGDLNGDGRPDLVSANWGANNVSRLLGNGDGTFQGAVNYPAGTGPYSVAIADLNGDGKSDLAVASNGSNNVSRLLGNGDGTFQGAVGYPAGTGPTSVAIGDLNGDGKLDLAVANAGSLNISRLLGNGDGTFQGAVNYAGVGNPASIALGDLNGDGKLDIVTANDTTGNISRFLGNGDGSFQAPASYAVGVNPRSVAIGDLNGDGKPDLAVANYTSHTVSRLLGNGDGTFQAPANYYGAGNNPNSIAIGDLNGDGKLDLTVVGLNSNGVSLYSGNGDGTFQTTMEFATATKPASAATGDVNGDGILDIVNANNTSNSVSVLLGNGNGTFQAKQDFGVGAAPYGVALADLNNDGKLDILTNNWAANNVSRLLGNGNGTFQAAVTYAMTGALGLNIADLNGDGKLDLLVPNNGANISRRLGNGDGTFQAVTTYATAGNGSRSGALGDLNGDGKLDIVVANFFTNNISRLLGNGDGTFQAAVTYAAQAGCQSVTMGDFNGDGKLDVAAANGSANTVSVFLGNGDGTFQAQVTYPVGGPAAVVSQDLNGDGKLDLIVPGLGLHGVSLLLGNGDGTFQASMNFGTGVNPRLPAIGDFNGDGKPDMAVGNDGNNNISILLHY